MSDKTSTIAQSKKVFELKVAIVGNLSLFRESTAFEKSDKFRVVWPKHGVLFFTNFPHVFRGCELSAKGDRNLH